ncbi:MAG: hypothetical protein ABJ275_07535 [Maricaulaceae bacterium]
MSIVSARLLKQRIRNRLIEYFDVSFDEIARWGTFEIINMWEDIVANGWDENFFNAPVFSKPEVECIQKFCVTWVKTADSTKVDLFDASKLRTTRHWVDFVEESRKAFSLFSERGKFSEDIEIDNS